MSGSVNINGRVLYYPPFTMEHEIDFSATPVGKVKIYNPSADTVAACEKKKNAYAPIIIEAGYEEDSGIVLMGDIVKFSYKPGLDATLELDVRDGSVNYLNLAVTKNYRGRVAASDVILDICSYAGIEYDRIELKNDHVWSRGHSWIAGTKVHQAFQFLALLTKSKYFYRYGKVNFLAPEKGYDEAYLISASSGLIKARKTSKGFKLSCLYLYKIGSGSIVEYEDENLESYMCKVRKGKHKFNPTGESGTEIEVDIIQ